MEDHVVIEEGGQVLVNVRSWFRSKIHSILESRSNVLELCTISQLFMDWYRLIHRPSQAQE